jgi:hypothetical protein
MATEFELRNASGMTNDNLPAAVSQSRSLIVSDEVSQWIKEGRVYQSGEGALTTPVALAPTDLVRQSPEFMIRVPAGIVIIPLMALAVLEKTKAVLQMLVSCCNNDPGVTNMTQVTPVNVNTRFSSVGSSCTAWTTNAGNTGTAPTGVADLYREYQQADRDAITTTSPACQDLLYNPRTGRGQECVIGNNSTVQAFLLYVLAGTASDSEAFSIVTWAEFTFAEYYGS